MGRIETTDLHCFINDILQEIFVLRNTTKDLLHEIIKNVSYGVNSRMKNGECHQFPTENFLKNVIDLRTHYGIIRIVIRYL